MKVFYGIDQITRYPRPVVALGVFDGVHRGHISVLKAAVKKAKAIKGTSIVLTFWPHPRGKENLYSLEHRLRLIDEVGVDVCVVVKFSRKFARVPAASFVTDILFGKIGASLVYVGKNFRFGKGTKGTYKTLAKFSKLYNFKLKAFKEVKIKNRPISSTYIRSLIAQGNITAAAKLLSRPVSILGTVIKGTSFGKKIGFPTANIDPHHEVIPPDGVYAVRVIFRGRKLNGVCYIGPKPEFVREGSRVKGQGSRNVEVYIFDFNRNIYGQYLELQFVKKIRDRKKFTNVKDLAAQIKQDIAAIKKILLP